MADNDVLTGQREELWTWLKKAGIVEGPVHRVVIDIRACEIVQIYVQRHADSRLIEAGLPDAILKAEIHDPENKPDIPEIAKPMYEPGGAKKPETQWPECKELGEE